MRNQDVEEKLKRAAADAAPDVLEAVLSRCREEEGKVIDMTANIDHKKSSTGNTKKSRGSHR